jgi:hypothetical protein
MNYQELSQQIHAAQVAKGFYDEPKSDAQIVALIISELYEMFDCHRKGKMLNQEQLYPFLLIDKFGEEWGEYDIKVFEETCKTTFEFEFVDVFIRVLDFAGYKQEKFTEQSFFEGLKGNFFQDIVDMNYHFIEFHQSQDIYHTHSNFVEIIEMLETFAKKYGIDFEPLISIKLAYSATLPYNHGKRY